MFNYFTENILETQWGSNISGLAGTIVVSQVQPCAPSTPWSMLPQLTAQPLPPFTTLSLSQCWYGAHFTHNLWSLCSRDDTGFVRILLLLMLRDRLIVSEWKLLPTVLFQDLIYQPWRDRVWQVWHVVA